MGKSGITEETPQLGLEDPQEFGKQRAHWCNKLTSQCSVKGNELESKGLRARTGKEEEDRRLTVK